MRTIVSALIQLFKDTDQRIPLFNPQDPTYDQVIADGYTKFTSSSFQILPTDSAYAIPFGNITTPRALYLRIEGAAGANVTINGGTPRQIRPISDASSAALLIPVSYVLETSADLVSVSIAHPGPSTADPIAGEWVLVGDAV